MLDKSIEYKQIVMEMSGENVLLVSALIVIFLRSGKWSQYVGKLKKGSVV